MCHRSWFGLCPVSLKIGSLKMCSGCKLVGYFGKEEQKTDWPDHKAVCKAVGAIMQRHGVKHITEKVSHHMTSLETLCITNIHIYLSSK